MAINVPVQLLLLAGLFGCYLRDLQRCCRRKEPTTAVLLAGMLAIMSICLVIFFVTDDGTYGSRCRTFYNSDLPDTFWIIASFIEQGLLVLGGLGLTVTWLATRYLRGGIRPDKTTTMIAGILVGLAAGAMIEYSQVRWGNERAMNPPRLVFFALLGGFLALVSRPFLFRKGRFQFGLKSLFALTAVWALIFGLLSPQWSQYQSETDAMASLATLLGGPVRCSRVEGLAGLAHVSCIDLPRCKIDDDKLDAVILQLRRLPRLRFVNTKAATLSQQGLERLENALPGVDCGDITSTVDRNEEILPDTETFQRDSESAGG